MKVQLDTYYLKLVFLIEYSKKIKMNWVQLNNHLFQDQIRHFGLEN